MSILHVEYAQPNYIYEPLAVSSKKWSSQWEYDGGSEYGMNIPNWNGEKTNAGNVVAVNNSWGKVVPSKSNDTAMCEAITSLGDSGVMCVFAAGNEKSNCDAYQSNYEYEDKYYSGYWQAHYLHQLSNVLIIGSNGPSGDPAYYTNYGKSSVDVFAPGGDYNDGYIDVEAALKELAGEENVEIRHYKEKINGGRKRFC